MTDNLNNAAARALKAEKQAERLERELELLKSQIKNSESTSLLMSNNGSPTPRPSSLNGGDSDSRINFQLSEKVKDLKYQLKTQKSDYTKSEETYKSKLVEYEEKLKRMREIFAQASKNIDRYRTTISSKEGDIAKLKVELEECKTSEQKFKSVSESQQLTIEKLNTEVSSQKAFYGSEIKQLEAKTRQLSTLLDQTKTNYEQYKKRAHILLEKNKGQKSDSSRVSELQDIIQQLQAQKSKLELEQAEKAESQLLIEHDLRKAIDSIHELEAGHSILTKERDAKERMAEELKLSFTNEKSDLETKLNTANVSCDHALKELNDLRARLSTLEMQQHTEVVKENNTNSNSNGNHTMTKEEQDDQDIKLQVIDLKYRLHELEEVKKSLVEQTRVKDIEIEKLRINTPSSPPSDESENETATVIESPQYSISSDVYSSMTSLLSPLVSRQITPVDERAGLEKQIQRLSEMLYESEDKVTVLKDQEKILKEELRKIDAFDKRQNMDVEYLKNVLVKFLISENKQAMVPIISKLLCLDQDETNKLLDVTK